MFWPNCLEDVVVRRIDMIGKSFGKLGIILFYFHMYQEAIRILNSHIKCKETSNFKPRHPLIT